MERLIAVARGDRPAGLVLTNARIVNTFTSEIEQGNVPLPIMGLMSLEPLEQVAAELQKLEDLSREIGCEVHSPFATLSFLALPVIPEIKLTDVGLVDASKVEMIRV